MIESDVGPAYYPSSIDLLYSNALVMVKRHVSDCSHLNDDLRRKYEALLQNSTGKRMDGATDYWAKQAKKIGLVNTREGIRFQRSAGSPQVVTAEDTTDIDAMATAGTHADPSKESTNAAADYMSNSGPHAATGEADEAHGVVSTTNVDTASGDSQILSELQILALSSESGTYPCPAIGEGWTCRVNPPRRNGRVDRYWYTPKGKMLKSAGAVIRFLAALEKSGDEEKALKMMKRMKMTSASRERSGSTKKAGAEENVAAASAGDEAPKYVHFDAPADERAGIEKAQSTKAAATTSIEDEDGDTKKHFPQVLHEILCNANKDSDVAMSTCWTSTGTAFNITDVDRFERNVLPRISERSSSFFSFRRRMYTWGFTRPRKGPNAGSYYHRTFPAR